MVTLAVAVESELFPHFGTLRYQSDWWATLEVDGDIARYYRSLLPREWNVDPSRSAHITVVRGEPPVHKNRWGLNEGAAVPFLYESGVKWNECFFWLRVVSKEIELIRRDLGLSVERLPHWNVPPEGYSKYFHLTVGRGEGYLPKRLREETV